MKEKIYKILPDFVQNFLVYLYNRRAYKTRYSGNYWKYREEKKNNRTLSLEELKEYQKDRYSTLINYVVKNSLYYKKTIGEILNVDELDNIRNLPILTKEKLRSNIDDIVVATNETLHRSITGGTTGKSLEVKNFRRNIQERFAFLDDFRSRFGYKLGEKTAWFSGKSLITRRDIKRKRFWKTDPFNKVRYYSTFHINENNLKYYVEDILKFKPKYLVGFPSTMFEIAKYGLKNGCVFPENVIQAIFPTAETTTDLMRNSIEMFFSAKVYNQYASSEGAPFIFECEKGNLHLELQSGVFEVLDDNDDVAQTGRLVVTSFINEGTPLIRYDIGDLITLEEESKECECGNYNPMVRSILGRSDDFIYSKEIGKINLPNISNTLKGVKGIVKFQVIQKKLEEIELLIIKDPNEYSPKEERKFMKNWRDRVGNEMKVSIKYVDDISNEKSGKFRVVKNSIKHLITDVN